MRCIAVIPARGGSKRLPRKNIISFKGKPIIAYTIEAAQKSKLFERVIVSTEDLEIADMAKQYNAEVFKRPKELATDKARVVDVCLNLIEEEKMSGFEIDILCCLYATAPLRNSDDIKGTFDLVKNGNCDSAMAVTKYYFPPHQALKFNQSKYLEPMWPEMINKQSQDVVKLLVDNGSTYVVSVPAFTREKSFYGHNLKGYIMPRLRSVDIDTIEDLELALLYADRSFL